MQKLLRLTHGKLSSEVFATIAFLTAAFFDLFVFYSRGLPNPFFKFISCLGLLFVLKSVTVSAIKTSSFIYLILGFTVFGLTYKLHSATNFFVITNIARVIELFFAFRIILFFNKKVSQGSRIDWRGILLILGIAVVFITLSFEYVSGEFQIIMLVRMIQYALLSTYILFKKNMGKFLNIWIIAIVGADFLSGVRLVHLISSDFILLQHLLQYIGYLAFALGVKKMSFKHLTGIKSIAMNTLPH